MSRQGATAMTTEPICWLGHRGRVCERLGASARLDPTRFGRAT